ncbi:hypothetical protein, partial [Bordetella pertussis]
RAPGVGVRRARAHAPILGASATRRKRALDGGGTPALWWSAATAASAAVGARHARIEEEFL